MIDTNNLDDTDKKRYAFRKFIVKSFYINFLKNFNKMNQPNHYVNDAIHSGVQWHTHKHRTDDVSGTQELPEKQSSYYLLKYLPMSHCMTMHFNNYICITIIEQVHKNHATTDDNKSTTSLYSKLERNSRR